MRILVIGDSCIDKFIYCDINRLCPEAPVPILQPVSTTTNPGMASNVAANLESGWNCKFVTKEDTPTNDITIAAGSAIIDFVQKDAAGDAGASTAGTAVSNILVEAASKQGDYISIFTDGTSYYAHGLSGVATGHTTS